MLRESLKNENFIISLEQSTWTAHEVITCVTNLSKNLKNRKTVVENGVIPLLSQLLKKGGAKERQTSTLALLVLSKGGGEIHKKVRSEPGLLELLEELSESSCPELQKAAREVYIVLGAEPEEKGIVNCPVWH